MIGPICNWNDMYIYVAGTKRYKGLYRYAIENRRWEDAPKWKEREAEDYTYGTVCHAMCALGDSIFMFSEGDLI